jgi:hypothetical protein
MEAFNFIGFLSRNAFSKPLHLCPYNADFGLIAGIDIAQQGALPPQMHLGKDHGFDLLAKGGGDDGDFGKISSCEKPICSKHAAAGFADTMGGFYGYETMFEEGF